MLGRKGMRWLGRMAKGSEFRAGPEEETLKVKIILRGERGS